MQKQQRSVDKVRASRDGHEYHEAWTARRAMQLFWPDSALTAIAVEGLSPRDQPHVSADTAEIADIVLYCGDTVFERSNQTTISQFKYSIADHSAEFRASDAKKTIEKFAKTYSDYTEKHGAQAVRAKLDFELITNRPIYEPLRRAVTKVENPRLLVASHIKPWRVCTSATERLDGANGLLLTPHVDRLFDRGLISFDDDGAVLLSSRLAGLDLERLGLVEQCRRGTHPFQVRQQAYLSYHRANVLLR